MVGTWRRPHLGKIGAQEAVTVGFPTVQQCNRAHRKIWLAKISLNHRCDRRVCYCALIFAADIVPSLSTIQWDLKKPACESTEGSARPLKKNTSCPNTKVQFLKKAIDRF